MPSFNIEGSNGKDRFLGLDHAPERKRANFSSLILSPFEAELADLLTKLIIWWRSHKLITLDQTLPLPTTFSDL